MSTVQTADLKELTIAQLREYAKHLRLPLERTATKEEILKIIEAKLNGRSVPMLASQNNVVPPGYAKIRVLEDPTPGAANIPVYVNFNGYEATLPRGVDIVVPMRVVRGLNDAAVNRKKQTIAPDANGREAFRETVVRAPSYPFQVIEVTPGPEVLTAHEQNKLKMQRPREKYRQMFGRWPRSGDLTRAIEKGLIKLDNEDSLPQAESDVLEAATND